MKEMKKVVKVTMMVVPWVLTAVFLYTPVASVKLNNFVRGREFYTLDSKGTTKIYKYDVKDLVTENKEPDLKNVEVTEKHTVTEQDVIDEMNYELSNYMDKTELPEGMTVETGMTVNLDYTADMANADLEGLSAEGEDVELGSGALMDGFEEAIVGHAIGESFKVELEITEDFSEELAGQKITFDVKINSGSVNTELDSETVTDEFVKNNFEDFDTVAEYKASMQKDVEAYYEQEFANNKKSAVLKVLQGVCDVTLPDELMAQEMEMYKQQFARMYCDEGMDLEEYLSAYYEMTVSEFETEVKENVETSVRNVLVCQYYAKTLGISVSDEDVNEYVEGLTTGTSYSSADAKEIYDLYESDYMSGEEYVERMALCEKVVDYFVDNEDCTFKYVPAEEENEDE